MKYKVCHPKIKGKFCITSNTVKKMKTIWNNKNTRKILHNNNDEILKDLIQLNNKCNDDMCLLKFFFNSRDNELSEELKNYAPHAPLKWNKNIHTWLNSKDIRSKLNQYEEVYKGFKFIGPSPVDWFVKVNYNRCVCNNLCNLDLDKELNNNIEKIGIVFNLDPHYKKGSHWVVLFIKLREKEFYYFDSTGYRCPIRIKKLYHKLNKDNSYKFYSNFDVVHQKNNSECGIYVIYFILDMLKNDDFEKFSNKKHLIRDNVMTEHRFLYFNKSS